MTVRASISSPAVSYDLAHRTAANCKAVAEAARSQFAANTPRQNLPQLWQRMVNFADEFGRLAAVSGLNTFAQAQTGDNTYDMAAELTQLQTDCEAVITEIVSVTPKDASGRLLVQEYGSASKRVIESPNEAPGQFVTLRNLLDTVIAQIS